MKANPVISLMALLGTGVIIIGAVGQAPGQDSKEFIRKIDEKQRKIQTLTAQFTQRKETALMKEPLVSSGTVRFKRPTQIYLRYEKPQSMEIAINGKSMRIYQTGKTYLEEYALGPGKRVSRFMEPFISVFQKPLAELEERYSVTYGGMEGGRLHRILLQPKEEKIQRILLRVELWADQESGAIERFTMMETNGDRLLLEFKNLKLNAPLADPDLTIQVPPSVKAKEAGGP